MYHILSFIFLFALWVVFSGRLDAFHLTMGALSSAFVTAFSGNLFFENRSCSLRSRSAECLRFIPYSFWLLYQILLSNLHVLYLALHPRGRDLWDPKIIRVRTNLRSDFAKVVLANSITLTPGTVTLKVEGDSLYVHAISSKAAKSLDGHMEARIARLFNEKEAG
jgi:multicomponent Na+:H+ antiporter subunit E